MQTKTYFASSVQAAMEVARKELGPDALLVTSRPASESTRALGRLEVTFAWEAGRTVPGGETMSIYGLPRQVISSTRLAETHLRQKDMGLDEIRSEISALRLAIGRSVSVDAKSGTADGLPPETDNADVRALCETGFGEDLARQIIEASKRDPVTGGASGNALDGSVRGPMTGSEGILRELTARLPVANFAPIRNDENRTLAFIGPAGRGKTTSLVKIAMRYGLRARIPTRIVSAGAHGVGAVEQTARYAAILGVPFQAMESYDSLALALQGERWNGLLLIDTPGTALGDGHEADSMERFFVKRNDIEKHLVIRAEARSADMQYMVARFAAMQPSRLLFTGLDEVRELGVVADTMIRSGIAATFLGTGPQIPDDLEEVSAAKLARSVWCSNHLAARAA